MSRVTVVVGRNGAGKSTLLEAAALVLGSTSGFRDILGFNIAEYVSRRGRHTINVKGSEPATISNPGGKVEIYTTELPHLCGELVRDRFREIAEDIAKKTWLGVPAVIKTSRTPSNS